MEKVTNCLQSLIKIYPHVKMSHGLTDIWIMALGEFTDERIQAGLKICFQQHTTGYMPTPGQFLEYCDQAKAESLRLRLIEQPLKIDYKSEVVAMPPEYKQKFNELMKKWKLE